MKKCTMKRIQHESSQNWKLKLKKCNRKKNATWKIEKWKSTLWQSQIWKYYARIVYYSAHVDNRPLYISRFLWYSGILNYWTFYLFVNWIEAKFRQILSCFILKLNLWNCFKVLQYILVKPFTLTGLSWVGGVKDNIGFRDH